MKNSTTMRDRYLQENLSTRLGELAANLARIYSFSSNPRNDEAVKHLVQESKLFIEWTAPEVDVDRAADLVDIQVQLARWQLTWSSIWVEDVQRLAMAAQAKAWSEQVLSMSGLLCDALTPPIG
jgi:hypothetical protein